MELCFFGFLVWFSVISLCTAEVVVGDLMSSVLGEHTYRGIGEGSSFWRLDFIYKQTIFAISKF